MSQPKFPRTFKFVGGPSRKRRRCAAPATREAESTSPQPRNAVTASAPASTNNAPRLLPSVTAVDSGSTASSSPESSGRYLAMSALPVDAGAAASVAMEPATSATGEPQPPLAAALPPTETLESLQEWSGTTELSVAADALESALGFDGPLSLFSTVFSLPASPGIDFASGAVPEHPPDILDEYLAGNQDPLAVDDGPSEASSSSTEDISRESPPEPEDDRSRPGGIAASFYRLFTQYDQEFCVWPLTHDFEANPFRYDIETGRGSPLLLHSILALSYKHIHRETGTCLKEARVHKRKAVELLNELEAELGSAMSRVNLLNGLLILMTLDCATSAQGPWVAHLSRAKKIIEALEVFRIPRTPKLQAQVEMLVWWDVALGLTTRQGFVLSRPTISSVFNSNDTSTFYNISGCPEELFTYMFRLGTYAREFELASHMTCVKFDMGPVLAVEKAIKEWHAPQYDDPDAGFTQPGTAGLPPDWGLDAVQAVHYLQDLSYCAQAWRFSLLVYIERVFKWRRGEASMARLSLLARKTLNNVFSCRRSVMIQKQLLLPVFLAACETEDENMREEARNYCSWWGSKTRYDMFITTLGLLEEVWTATGRLDSWWGSLIDQKSGVGSARQYLFG